MKVLMLGRIELFNSSGGDKVQIENTAKELRVLGVDVTVATGFSVDMRPYDLVHVFQLDWTPETYLYARKAKMAGKPLVLSPIHHSVSEVKKFDDIYPFDFRRISRLLFKEQHSRDTFKNVYRSLFDVRKLYPTLISVFMGLKKMHKKTLAMADVVLVQTDMEAKDLKDVYGVDFTWQRVPNGVGSHFINPAAYENTLGLIDYILVVGRIEPRKNQLNIIKAVALFREKHNLDVPLVFVGRKASLKHFEYVFRFDRVLAKNPWIHYIKETPYEFMPNFYHFAKIGVSASWFETTGLTSLEALFSGANAVASGAQARAYLGELASYCLPEDVYSIAAAIETAYFAPRPNINTAMLHTYTWENAARKTAKVYHKVLEQRHAH